MDTKLFGHMPDGTSVHAFTLRGASGMSATIIEYGGRLTALRVPIGDGDRDVTLGLPTLADYLADGAHLGALTGRYANRIAGGRFKLDGREHELPQNNGRNTLHGGPAGFASRVWRGAPDGEDLVLTLRSVDGDQGFPGTVDVTVRYRLDGETLEIDYAARCDAPTVVNLTNHAYFNLAGAGTVMDHVLELAADRFIVADAAAIPTGELRPVAGTAFDFRAATPIGARIDDDDGQLRMAGGYDHCFVLADTAREQPRFAASVTAGGLHMDVLTTEPGVQLILGNFLGGAPFSWRTGMCLETQHFPDSPNQPSFPSTILRPGQAFASRTQLRFATTPPSNQTVAYR